MVTNEHTCACYRCAPDQFPHHETRQSEGHVAAYFGEIERCSFKVYLNGEELKACFEADAVAGTAIVAREPAHVCRSCLGRPRQYPPPDTSGGACLERITGHIEVRTAVPA